MRCQETENGCESLSERARMKVLAENVKSTFTRLEVKQIGCMTSSRV